MRLPMSGVAALAAVAVVVSACATAPAGGASPAASSASAASPGSSDAAGSAAPSAAATSGPPPSAPALGQVDLTLSGWKAVTVKGTAGCLLADTGGVPSGFNFQASEADYAGLGEGLFISEGLDGSVTIKWIVGAGVGFISGFIKGVVSADHRSITLDDDVNGSPGIEHIKGTIACP